MANKYEIDELQRNSCEITLLKAQHASLNIVSTLEEMQEYIANELLKIEESRQREKED